MGENNGAWSKQAVQREQHVELSWAELSRAMSSGGDVQGTEARRDNWAKGHPRLSLHPPLSAGCRGPPTTGNIRCACECPCFMVNVLLRQKQPWLMTRLFCLYSANTGGKPSSTSMNRTLMQNQRHPELPPLAHFWESLRNSLLSGH